MGRKPIRKTEAQLAAQVAAWNNSHPVGTPVNVLMDDQTTVKHTKTTSEAWLMGGHSAMIKVEGISGGYDLERVKPA